MLTMPRTSTSDLDWDTLLRDFRHSGDNGGKTAAVLMSLCTNCKNFRVDPFAYLRDVLDRVSTHPNSRIEELLPDRWEKPEPEVTPGRKG
jgi:hypothetical protein